MNANLWDIDEPVTRFNLNVPVWIDEDITAIDVAAIVQGGCSSGAYMPAVTYQTASETMGRYGDDILDYIQDSLGELYPPNNEESWSGMAVHYLSCAVELWASSVEDELQSIIDDMPVYAVGNGLVGCLYDNISYFDNFDDAKQWVIDLLKDNEEHSETEEQAEAWCHLAEEANLESKPFTIVEQGRVISVFELDFDQQIEAIGE